MQTWIKEKLAQIDDLFPPQRIAASQERWSRLWHNQPPKDRYPFVYAPVLLSYYAAGFTAEERLRTSLDEFILRGQLNDDFIPAIFPGCHQGTLPSLFGAEPVVVNGDFTCKRLLSDVSQIASLPDPEIKPGSVAAMWLEMERYVLEETEGRLPINTTDMQGPADVCGQIWNYDDLFVAAYEDTPAYDALMGKATDAFILLWQKQKDLLGDRFVGTHLFGWNWVPPDVGATLSADSLVMISPDFFATYYQSYLERISRRFGGLVVHSCGDFKACLPALQAVPGLKGINAGQMSVEQLVQAGLNGNTVAIAGTSLAEAPALFGMARQNGLRLALTINGIWPVANGQIKPPLTWDATDWARLHRDDQAMAEALRAASVR